MGFWPRCRDFSWRNLFEKGSRCHVLSLLCLELLGFIVAPLALDRLRASGIIAPDVPPPPPDRAIRVRVFGTFAQFTCLSQWIFEFFLPLESFSRFKSVSGGVCLSSGTIWGIGTFIDPQYDTLVQQVAVVLIIVTSHIFSISWIRGLQQHLVNERRRANEPPLRVSGYETARTNEGGRQRACSCTRATVHSKFLDLLSSPRAKTARHCTFIVFFKLITNYLDFTTDIATGFFLLYTGDSPLPEETRLGVGVTLVTFGLLDFLPCLMLFTLPTLSETMSLWVPAVQIICEIPVFPLLLFIAIEVQEAFTAQPGAVALELLTMLTTVAGLVVTSASLMVYRADQKFFGAMRRLSHHISQIPRQLTHRFSLKSAESYPQKLPDGPAEPASPPEEPDGDDCEKQAEECAPPAGASAKMVEDRAILGKKEHMQPQLKDPAEASTPPCQPPEKKDGKEVPDASFEGRSDSRLMSIPPDSPKLVPQKIAQKPDTGPDLEGQLPSS
uniref:Uncharacterized protein n=1 Tax=Chromera velia CCMP2878 TaxID=1169474 RepID=A0A0G4HA31_9ALVE|eukprot:Cvel_25421.t1-p1 / transcript=Cvel_25421.t1 / gene=Cvel_25421 / organism=Chromera_velia_CCMP2878 / gene_product=hypothetical protein / transcript_product=hypothetical protein / location=Cvel_scaffold2878:10748-13482(-) / protein_length=498 / sequence_SO=supercontig / SO=protein_coding / is_pseudo=false